MYYPPTAYELDSSCYHHKEKKCRVVWYPLPKKDDNGKQVFSEKGKKEFINIVMCKTHKVRLCYKIDFEDVDPHHCFWERGGHFDQLSQGSNTPYNLDTYPFDESNENPIESLP